MPRDHTRRTLNLLYRRDCGTQVMTTPFNPRAGAPPRAGPGGRSGAVLPPADSAPARLSRPPSRSGAPPSTGFGNTVFDLIGQGESRRPAQAESVFNVCHVGVVLRALLFVHGLLLIGVTFVAASPRAWIEAMAAGAGVALPAVLLWLVVACLCKRPLAALPMPAQAAAAVGLGAFCGGAAAALVAISGVDLSAEPRWLSPLLAPALAGAAIAAAMFQWLQLRAKAALPAETTARLAELQSRIRPHFLFNTLNTALTLVRIDPLRAEGVLEDLAELFRVAITDSGELATLADEVALAQRYLAIEQIRFGERLRLVWELDPATDGARMPPLLLQPLLENAVRHGVEPADEGGVIRVRTRMRMGRAEITIVNTVPAAPSRPGSGMALRNVRERLQLMHDVASQFDARLDGAVFRVQIVVPL